MQQKLKTTTEQVAELLRNSDNIALFCHTHPDGDTIGATVALCIALEQLGKKVTMFCDSELGSKLSSFSQTQRINKTYCGKHQLMVAIDCGDIFRLGEFSGVFNDCANTITIDHHCGEYYSHYNCLHDYSSTCQIIYEILQHMNVDISSEIATYLYMGLCTDTGNFAHNNTDEASFRMASDMCRFGADIQKVNRVFFKDVTLSWTKLLAKCLSRVRTYYDNQLVLLYVTKADLAELGLDLTATEGIVQYAINVDTAKVGVCMCEYSDNNYKVSMRGKDFDVRDVCSDFGGGGHMLASGCMIAGLFEDVVEKIVRAVGIRL